MRYLYLACTIIFTVYGQIIFKWQVNRAGTLPFDVLDKVYFLFRLVFNPWILSGFFAAFLASLSWIAAITKFDLNVAYPFMSLSFVLVLIGSSVFFHESVSLVKVLGIAFIIVGVIIGTRG